MLSSTPKTSLIGVISRSDFEVPLRAIGGMVFDRVFEQIRKDEVSPYDKSKIRSLAIAHGGHWKKLESLLFRASKKQPWSRYQSAARWSRHLFSFLKMRKDSGELKRSDKKSRLWVVVANLTFGKSSSLKTFGCEVSFDRNRGWRSCGVFGFLNPYTSPSVIVQIKKSIHFQRTEQPSFLTSCRVFNFQKRHKCQNFLLSLNRDQGLRGCDVFGFVNPYTFCELKNRYFWQLR